MEELVKHYNKINEDKRLTRRHGMVEYITSMKYIKEVLAENPTGMESRILDIGAGTGRYSIALAELGYDVTAVELVKYNLGILKKKSDKVKAFQGNALKLSRFEDETFDVTLLFGPMYHLYTYEDKLKALEEAKRVTKKNGVILVAYIMNEYSVLRYGFKENHIKESIEQGKLSKDFKVIATKEDLYDYVRLEQINQLNQDTELDRIKIIAADGPANYMRREFNAMDEETYQLFLDYHLSTCERPELIGASSHTVDILRKK